MKGLTPTSGSLPALLPVGLQAGRRLPSIQSPTQTSPEHLFFLYPTHPPTLLLLLLGFTEAVVVTTRDAHDRVQIFVRNEYRYTSHPPTHPPIDSSTSFEPPRPPLPSYQSLNHPPTHAPTSSRGEVAVDLVCVENHYGTADMLRAVKDKIKTVRTHPPTHPTYPPVESITYPPTHLPIEKQATHPLTHPPTHPLPPGLPRHYRGPRPRSSPPRCHRPA